MPGRAQRTAALFVLVALLGAAPLSAEPRLPALFGDHMVLQRGRAIPVWGLAEPGEAVTVTLDLSARETTAGADGRWRVDLPAHDAGGPFTLTVRGRTTRVYRDVLVGEVWLASGQSNMTLELTRASRADVAAAWHDRLRLFTVAKTTTIEPERDVTGAWRPCTPDSAADFSAVAYYFGRRLQQELNVPVGVIHTSWPGSAAEEWTAPDVLEREPQFAPITDAWKRRQAAWTGGEHNPLAIELQFTALDLVDTKNSAKTPPLPLGPGGAPAPWRFAWDAAPEMALEWGSGAEPSARLRGELRARDAARLTIDLRADRSPANLVAYDAVRVRVRGTGSFRLRALQPSVADGDDYGSDAIVVSGDAREVVVPLGSLKQAGWGMQRPFTPAEVTALQVEPLLGANGARPPAGLYNAMILPLVPYAIQGAVWYQGESNASRGQQYRALLPALIGAWRSAWKQGDFPFLVVQLPGYRNPSPTPQESGWAELREAQVMTLRTPNTGLAITIDAGEALGHPPCQQAARR